MLDLGDLQIFERVAALSSFSEAARALGLPRSNVSRSVARLEEALDARLFHRSTREVTLTAAGIALRDRASEILVGATEALDYVGSLAHGPRGHIRINSGVGFGINVIAESLPEFLLRYPEVTVTLDLESRTADLVGEAIDVAVRLGSLTDSSLISTRLGRMQRHLCAAPAYLEQHGIPLEPDQLAGHDIIEMPGADGRPRPWSFTRGKERFDIAIVPRVTVNEALTIHKLALAGAGIGIVSAYLCAPAISNGSLVCLLPEWSLPTVEVSLVFPSRRDLAPAVRAFADFMREMSHPGNLWEQELRKPDLGGPDDQHPIPSPSPKDWAG